MLIAELGQHLVIASREEAITLSSLDRDFWNVISIHDQDEAPAAFLKPRRVHRACFDDVESVAPGASDRAATGEDLAQVFDFADSIGQGPLLIHCRAGLSRSPAVALAWMCRRFKSQEDFANRAMEVLLRVRPQAVPNALVLRLGLEQFLAKPAAAALATSLLKHPGLLANRFPPR